MPDLSEERSQWIRRLEERDRESDRNWWIAFWLSFFLGAVGADRFYLGYPYLGLLKLATFGGFGVWWLVDLGLLLSDRIVDDEGRAVRRPAQASIGPVFNPRPPHREIEPKEPGNPSGSGS